MEKYDQLFLQLLYLMHHTAMQELGKIANPVTGEVKRDLEKAQQAIDMLEMLEEKTKGNISEELDKTQSMMLSELRINYADRSKQRILMEQPENSKSIFRDRRTKRIIIVLVAAVSTLLILLILQRMHSKEQMAAFEAKVIEETALRDDLDDLIDEHDLLRNEYSELNDQLFQKDSIIRAYAADIKKLLRSEGQLKEAKGK